MRFVFRFGATPFGEVLPFRGDGADARFVTVGKDDQGVGPEELGDDGFVVAQVVVVGVFGGFGYGLELDEEED